MRRLSAMILAQISSFRTFTKAISLRLGPVQSAYRLMQLPDQSYCIYGDFPPRYKTYFKGGSSKGKRSPDYAMRRSGIAYFKTPPTIVATRSISASPMSW
jgi:hypothetical protein